MEIQFRTKTANEKEICTHLFECKDSFRPPLDQTVDVQDYSKKIVRKSITFEAWDNNKLIGCVAAYFNDLEKKIGYITNVSVSREYSGNGIASKLMANCINYAQSNQYKEIFLEVCIESKEAIQLYNKFEFKKVKQKDNFLIMKHTIFQLN